MQTLEVHFTITQERAIKLKFENRLDNMVKQRLCEELLQQLINSSHINFTQYLHSNDWTKSNVQSQITFIARIDVQKPE